MSFFGRDSEPKPTAPQPPARPTAPSAPAPPQPKRQDSTHIAFGSKVVGEITGTAELVIHGEVHGQINLQSRVVVGPEGRIEGEVEARAVEVGGKVSGNVRGHERVEVLVSGSLEGDVVSPRVVIAEGAFFKGQVDMTARTDDRKAKTATEPEKKADPALPKKGPLEGEPKSDSGTKTGSDFGTGGRAGK